MPAARPAASPCGLYVGDYEARATPIADTDPATALARPSGSCRASTTFVAVGAGFGHARFTFIVQRRPGPRPAGEHVAEPGGRGERGDGLRRRRQCRQADRRHGGDELGLARQGRSAGKQVTVRLDPSQASQQVRRVQVSAMLRPNIGDAADPGGQNRFTALRQFQIWTCEAKAGVDCTDASDFSLVFTSPADAFPSVVPRPRAPELIVRTFVVPQTKATHVRLVVAAQPVHGHARVPGRPGRRPDQLDRLRRDDDRQPERQRRARPRRGAAGLLTLTCSSSHVRGLSPDVAPDESRTGVRPAQRMSVSGKTAPAAKRSGR